MGLDAGVRCQCIKEGKAKPHPFPDMLVLDPVDGPELRSSATEEQWEAHDAWLDDADLCPHHGWVVTEYLGNITAAEHMREALDGVSETTGRAFPILRERVVYSGTHTGDSIEALDVPYLLTEMDYAEKHYPRGPHVELVKRFFAMMRRLAMASLATGNPIQF